MLKAMEKGRVDVPASFELWSITTNPDKALCPTAIPLRYIVEAECLMEEI